jgi:acyl-CoA thioester hydrolase
MSRPIAQARSAYKVFFPISTRWLDNDVYGHVNNVVYYGWFDTAVNRFLIEQGGLDIHAGAFMGLVVESQCNYFAPLAYPQEVQAGLRVAHVGHSSVRYEAALFAGQGPAPSSGGDALCAASGHLVHVYVDRLTRRPVALPAPLLSALAKLRC